MKASKQSCLGLVVIGIVASGCTKTNFQASQIETPVSASNTLIEEPIVQPEAPVAVVPPVKAECDGTVLVGSGTEADPFQIDEPCDFRMIDSQKNAYWKVVSDIDFSTSKQNGSFFSVKLFGGHFDGSFKTIKNFKLDCLNFECEGGPHIKNMQRPNRALFQRAADANFENVILKNFVVRTRSELSTYGHTNIGGLVAEAIRTNLNKISVDIELEPSGDINEQGLYGVGGIAGDFKSGTISESSAVVIVKGNASPHSIGTVAGAFCGSEILNTVGRGLIANGWVAGGLVGGCGNPDLRNVVENSFFVGNVDYRAVIVNGVVHSGFLVSCQLNTGLGFTPGNLPSLNSFWVGASNCPKTALTATKLEDALKISSNFDPLIWKISSDALPELRWLK